MGNKVRDGAEFIGFLIDLRRVSAHPGHLGSGKYGIDPGSGQLVDSLFHAPEFIDDLLIALILPHDGRHQRVAVLIHRYYAGALARQSQPANLCIFFFTIYGSRPPNFHDGV